MEGATEGVAHAELEDSGYELGGTAEEDCEAEDGLIWANAAEGVGVGEAVVTD